MSGPLERHTILFRKEDHFREDHLASSQSGFITRFGYVILQLFSCRVLIGQSRFDPAESDPRPCFKIV